ncbi:MAG TPA: HAD family hydrolase [Gammaproteobacteria bacterium]|nr:HAD family hydrolase [Gammaproteobacteria bacterium]
MLKLVIFDCDGVLVDSERVTNAVFAKMLNELGLAVSLDDMFEYFVGKSMPQCLELVTDMLGKVPPKDFEERYQTRINAALESELQPVAGVPEMLNELKLPYCVASSGSLEKMRTTLGITGLLRKFDGKLYSVTQVAQAKPAPDVFLYAAAQCGVEPASCAVVEDTPIGVAAGRAAGMTVFGYAGLMPAMRLRRAGAHRTFAHMRKLPALLAS